MKAAPARLRDQRRRVGRVLPVPRRARRARRRRRHRCRAAGRIGAGRGGDRRRRRARPGDGLHRPPALQALAHAVQAFSASVSRSAVVDPIASALSCCAGGDRARTSSTSADSAIWDANEAFYVETPREMIERGDFVSPDVQLPAAVQQAGPELLDRRGVLQGCSASRSASSGCRSRSAPWRDLAAAFFLGVARRGRPRRFAAHRASKPRLWAAVGLAVAPRLLMFGPAHLHRHLHLDVHGADAAVLRAVGALPGSPPAVPALDVRVRRPWHADEGSGRRVAARAGVRYLPARARRAQARRRR